MSATETKRWKRGDIGPDGRVFWAYNKKSKSGERWVTLDKFEKYKAQDKARCQMPEYKAWMKAYRQTPERKAWVKAYRQMPEYKAQDKARCQMPEYKARYKTPEYKVWDKARRKSITQEESARSYMTALLAVQQLSEALKNKNDNDNENAK